MAANDPESIVREETDRIAPELIAVRRDLHRFPELAFEEKETAARVAAELSRLGIAPRTGVGRTGVVGMIEGGRPGPTLLIRADMDALPIHERTGLAFASAVDGKMHACGHDIHTTTLLGAAAVLKRLAPGLGGRVLLVFQPAEEILEGAAAMIADGVLDDPKPDYALGFHNWPYQPVGTITYVNGACQAASDAFDILFKGRSGHAAHPHQAIDPVAGAALFIGQLQTLVSREVNPLSPAVVTVGRIEGGTVRNIIPDTVLLQGTVRTLDAVARDAVEAGMGRLLAGVETGLRLPSDFTYARKVPPLVNDTALLGRVVTTMRAAFGDGAVREGTASMGAEDFACFAEAVPAAHLRIGSGAPGRKDSLHNSEYQPDEASIAIGVQALSRAALDLLR
ncbi:M20 metallopeptidase family protein [Elioraea rosea]|uniref:M20 metallopeptidase family protein n=1 Tax=Elioraea rosea TaxID=2492390 RepID=UPI0011829DED|nr:M20 family metallopeptidase [Elioraea rosea]